MHSTTQRPNPRSLTGIRRLTLFLSALIFASLLRFYLPFPFDYKPTHPETVSTLTLLTALHQRQRQYKVISDHVVYNRYARVYSRTVRFPDDQQFEYDVWGRVWKNDSFGVVTVVPFDRRTNTFTLIREYNIAHAKFTYGFPQGCLEKSKHSSSKDAAAAELEEEAALKCRNWVDLMKGNTAPQDKYQRESVWFYLCTDAIQVVGGRKRDLEEDMDIVHGVTSKQIVELVQEGVMQSNQIAAAMLALHYLKDVTYLR